ncbi:MAG: hypothetical protein COA84_02350 [Robiginitomaculum sp.]|nr:MAG: hypothetical protein COA84_02350 [Robiginitomaculum sp.]
MPKKHEGKASFILTVVSLSFMENAGVRGMGLLATGHRMPIIKGLCSVTGTRTCYQGALYGLKLH